MSGMKNEVPAETATIDSGRKTATKKNRGRIAILFVLVAAGAVGYVLYSERGTQYTDDASIQGDQIVVSSQILGQIRSMAVDEQDHVSTGQVLVRLDDRSLKDQERQAIASKEYAEQNVSLAQVKLDQAKIDFQRATVQLQDRIIPQEQYDHLSEAYSAAQTQYKIAQTRQKMAEAADETIETNLDHTIISSTIDGVVAKKWAMPGDVVQPAQPIYTLYDLNDLWVEANFKETQIHFLRPGDPATITIDAYPGYHLSGKIENIGTATASEFALIPPDNATGNFTKVTQRVPVKISLDPRPDSNSASDPVLVPGLSVEVHVATGSR